MNQNRIPDHLFIKRKPIILTKGLQNLVGLGDFVEFLLRFGMVMVFIWMVLESQSPIGGPDFSVSCLAGKPQPFSRFINQFKIGGFNKLRNH